MLFRSITDYHVEVNRLRRLAHVVGAAPAILGQGLISGAGDTEPIQLKGIDPGLEPQVTDIGRAMQSGSLDALSVADGPAGIILGKDLADKLHVGVGDPVTVLTTAEVLTPMGLRPRSRPLRVAGLFSLGLYEFDSTYGFVSLDVARRLMDKDLDLIQLRVDDVYRAPSIAVALSAELGSDYVTRDWGDMNRSLFSALSLEKIAVSLAIGLIVMVAALNIVASLILLVIEKHRDIAILKTMGASARSVTTIFMIQGVVIGTVGTAIGSALGYAIARTADRYQLIRVPVDVYQVSHLPFKVLPLDFALVVAAAMLVCFVATIYPSRQAARLDPAQALRYE